MIINNLFGLDICCRVAHLLCDLLVLQMLFNNAPKKIMHIEEHDDYNFPEANSFAHIK